jgi:hypothetical protein
VDKGMASGSEDWRRGGINRTNVEEIGVDDSLVDGSSETAGSRKHLSRPSQEYLKCHIGLCLELRCEYLRSGSGCGSDKVL